jgi:hypothetical protein
MSAQLSSAQAQQQTVTPHQVCSDDVGGRIVLRNRLRTIAGSALVALIAVAQAESHEPGQRRGAPPGQGRPVETRACSVLLLFCCSTDM